jgi:prolyl oligopeptidase
MQMNRRIVFAIALVALFGSATYAQQGPAKAPVHEVTDTYFGQKLVDPYRWMEDSKNGDFVAWMKAQADYTQGQLDDCR